MRPGPLKNVALLFLGGIAVNKLSDAFEASAPIVIGGSLVVAVLLVLRENTVPDVGGLAAGAAIGRPSAVIAFSLLSLCFGALIAALSLIPLFNNVEISLPRDGVINLYEVGVVSTVTVVACLSAWRQRSGALLAYFVLGSTTGTSLALVYLKPTNLFTPTFLGAIAFVSLITALVYLRADLETVVREFLGFGRSRPS